MRCLTLIVVGLLLLAMVEPFSAQAAGNTKASTRRLVFPKQFSLGTLYGHEYDPRDFVPPDGSNLEKYPPAHIGQARGVVTVPASQSIYLLCSYDLITHPEILRTIDPNIVSVIFFNKVGIVQPLDKMLEPISHLTGLKRLDLQYSEMSDDCLKPLKVLTNLEALDLNMCDLKGTFLKDLLPLTKLKELDLSDCKLLPVAYTYMTQFPQLKVLNLARTEANDKSLAELAKLKNLETIYLDSAKITPQGLKSLLACKKLRHLELTDTNLSAADLCCLAPLRLESLMLPHRLSGAEMVKLSHIFPHANLGLRRNADDPEARTLFAPTK